MIKRTRSRFSVVSCCVLLGLTAAPALGARMMLLPAGVQPGDVTTWPYTYSATRGEVIEIDIWAEDTDPVAIQFLQVQMPCVAAGGTIGAIDFLDECPDLPGNLGGCHPTALICMGGVNDGLACNPGRALDQTRTDYIFFGLTTLGLGGNDGFCPGGGVPPLDPFNESPVSGTGTISVPPVVTDPVYLCTWSFTVSTDAAGLFTLEPICYFGAGCEADLTFLVPSSGPPIPLTMEPLLVEVPCDVNADCDDGLFCSGVATCVGGQCQAGSFPCGGSTPLCDEDNDRCVACLGDGDCTDQTDTACDNPDTCDGATGTCLDNYEPSETPCGDPTDTECDNSDTCNGSGTCLDNLEPNGTACDDLLFCNVGEACTAGSCSGGTARDCGDGIPCTTDTCDEIGDVCDNDLDPGFCLINNTCYPNGQTNPANECQACNTAQDTSSWSAKPNDTSCTDDGNDCTEDTCQAGTCSHPNELAGVACGDPADSDCDHPDTCDGMGACEDNLEPSGTACGDPTDTECDNPDTCNGSGTCLDNLEPNGTDCDDLLFCNVDEACSAGSCSGGTARDCDDGVPCTTDTCDEIGGVCDNDLDPGFCLINNTCYSDGQTNPANECEACDTAQSTSSWSAKPDGMSCTDDGNECTDDFCEAGACSHPSEPAGTACAPDLNNCTADECDGAGVCIHPDEPADTPCGDQSVTDCTDSDTCDGAGTCLPNDDPEGTGCGDPSDTDCTNPDTCDGGGGCQPNDEVAGTSCPDDGNECTDDECDGAGACTHPNEPNGTACGDPADTDCTAPDTCNGSGSCLSNHENPGLGCTDDGNDCTDDECDGAGACTHPNQPPDTACGDPADTDCDDPDTCDGGGICLDNFEPGGTSCTDDGNDCTDDECDGAGACTHPNRPADTACGDPADSDCDHPDTCDGTGACEDNLEPSGTPCGDPTDHDCTDPDSCTSGGACFPRHAPDGSMCNDFEECTWDDQCTGGVCDGVYEAHPFADFYPFGDIVPPCPEHLKRELGDGFSNMLDVYCAFNAFNEGFPYTQCPCADVAPCGGDSFVNMQDVYAAFNAFNELPACSVLCP